jgi:hypothetical protein
MDAGGLQGQEQFDNEVALLSRLSHPALVRLLYVVREPSLKCLIYELMPGGNMEAALVRGGGGVLGGWVGAGWVGDTLQRLCCTGRR